MVSTNSLMNHSYLRDSDDFGLSSNLAALKSQGGYGGPRGQMSMNMLSAQPFPQAPQQVSWGPMPPQHLFGGLAIDSQPNTEPNTEDESIRPSKRTRTSKSSSKDSNKGTDTEAAGKKQRGRPRLESRDETAADRRRTQIRLAQRAYRHRKETTIASLKENVSDLQGIIEQMNKSFGQLHDNIVDSGVLVMARDQTVPNKLKTTMDEFSKLAKSAVTESDQEDETDGKASTPPSRKNSTQRPVQQPTPSITPPTKMSNDAEKPSKTSTPLKPAPPFMSGPYVSPPPTLGGFDPEQDMTDNGEMRPQDFAMVQGSQPGAGASLNFGLDVNAWNGSMMRTFQGDGSYTYSFQETTFARRLHRLCLEHAFRHLSNPAVDPGYIARTFRFTFTFSNRKRMLSRFQELLQRKAGEPLEIWHVPYFHIGGAGTHYPRRDKDGRPLFPPNLVSPASVLGPQEAMDANNPRNEETTQKLLESIGYGGDWYDSQEVEEFLKTKGIFLDAQSSYITVDASVVNKLSISDKSSTAPPSLITDSSSSSSTSSPRTSRMGSEQISATWMMSDMPETFPPPSLVSSTVPEGEVTWNWPFEGMGGLEPTTDVFNPNFNPNNFNPNMSHRTVTLDVEKFLNRLVDRGACLGRAPGFRKLDVESALVFATQDSM